MTLASEQAALVSATEQLTTFRIDGTLFGIEIMKVQEVTSKQVIFQVPLSPKIVSGLINLRGQIATAINLREALGCESIDLDTQMSIICKIDGNLLSLVVDSIGDVLDVNTDNFEPSPETISKDMKKFIKGIYKLNEELLSVLDLESLARELSPTTDSD